jgi:hypothetical protein
MTTHVNLAEIRNLVGELGCVSKYKSWLQNRIVEQIDRVYIRKGRGNPWGSITFIVKRHPNDEGKPRKEKIKGARFWAKLAHVNEIVCEPIAEEDRVK